MNNPAPIVSVSYEDKRYEIAFGLRGPDDPNGEVGIDETVGGLATALGILLSRVAYLHPEAMDPERFGTLKESFWEDVKKTMDIIMAGDERVSRAKR